MRSGADLTPTQKGGLPSAPDDIREAFAVVEEALLFEWPRSGKDARASLALIKRRVEELEILDKMRDDGEHHLLGEIEARDARIAQLEKE